jgi:hypothetical protein
VNKNMFLTDLPSSIKVEKIMSINVVALTLFHGQFTYILGAIYTDYVYKMCINYL